MPYYSKPLPPLAHQVVAAEDWRAGMPLRRLRKPLDGPGTGPLEYEPMSNPPLSESQVEPPEVGPKVGECWRKGLERAWAKQRAARAEREAEGNA